MAGLEALGPHDAQATPDFCAAAGDLLHLVELGAALGDLLGLMRARLL